MRCSLQRSWWPANLHNPVQRLLRFDAAHDIDDAAVAGLDDADDLVVELDRVWATDDAVRDVTQLFDGDERELLPGDLINIEGIAVLKVVADLAGEESCDQCALTCVDSSTHRIGGEKEAALCMMCDCEGTRRSAPCVHLEV